MYLQTKKASYPPVTRRTGAVTEVCVQACCLLIWATRPAGAWMHPSGRDEAQRKKSVFKFVTETLEGSLVFLQL